VPNQHATTPLGTRLPEAERQAVKDAAQAEGITVNEWLRRAIRERLARGAAEPVDADPVAYARRHVTSPGAHALLDEVERGRQRRASEGG